MSGTGEYREQFKSDESAERYDEEGYTSGSYADLLDRIAKEVLLREIARQRMRTGQINLLDFACGTGRMVMALENAVDLSVGLDISPNMLKRAKLKTTRTEYFCGDITADDGLCRGPFDLIVSFRFVTNAEPELRETALKRLRERMRDRNSRFIFNVHRNLNSYLAAHWALRKLMPTPGHDWHYMSVPGAVRLARRCGFTVERISGFGFLSSHVAKRMPFEVALSAERVLGRVPLANLLGTEFIVVCRPSDRL